MVLVFSKSSYFLILNIPFVYKFQELSSTFITPETLEQAIDHAIANPTDYNFAIDLKGNKYEGRDTPAIPSTEERMTAAN